MHIYLRVVILVICCVCAVFSQSQPPNTLYDAMNKYLYGQGFIGHLKILGYDTTIQPSEIDFGIPAEVYVLKKNGDKIIDSVSIDEPVMNTIEPAGIWEFCLTARGKSMFRVTFILKNNKFEWLESGGTTNNWKEMREVYPESTGVNPIIIQASRQDRFLHFPQINAHNLTLDTDSSYRVDLKNTWHEAKKNKSEQPDDFTEIDGLISTLSDSYAKLNDSRKTFQYLKNRANRLRKQKSIRQGMEK